MRIFVISIMLLITTLLAACSSQPAYRAAQGNGFGYSEQQISDNYYRVSFKARGDDNGKARAYAMRRAAELTQTQGYDWFVIVQNDSTTERQTAASQLSTGYRQTTVRDCGLLGCRSRTIQQPEYSASLSAGDREQVEVALEIRMGKGVMPDNAAAYPAHSKQ